MSDSLNAEQQMALQSLLVAAMTTKVVGPAGTGKTRVAEEWVERLYEADSAVEVLWIAPYNSHVDGAKGRAQVSPALWQREREYI